jgi:hypothetical protein
LWFLKHLSYGFFRTSNPHGFFGIVDGFWGVGAILVFEEMLVGFSGNAMSDQRFREGNARAIGLRGKKAARPELNGDGN